MSALIRVPLLLTGLFFASLLAAQSDDYQEATRLFRAGQLQQALDRVENVLKANPKEARSRFLKGLILTEQNKPGDAIKIFSALTEDFPELPEPYNNLAVLYASQGQYDRARSALEMAIRTHPSYATAHENLGDIYAKMASQAYDKALQLDKGNSAAETKLGLIKDLFSGGARGAKPTTGRTEIIAKAATAASAKPAPAVSAPTPATASLPANTQVAQAPAQAAPAPVPTPAAKPVATAADPAADVISTVNNWARAWSNNDVNGYLGYYAPSFQPPGGEPRSDWEASRKLRIAKPKKIEVQIESPRVKIADDKRVTVTFRQIYRSPGLKSNSTKTLVMVKSGDRWLIHQERVGG